MHIRMCLFAVSFGWLIEVNWLAVLSYNHYCVPSRLARPFDSYFTVYYLVPLFLNVLIL